jgi:hypothetical protein
MQKTIHIIAAAAAGLALALPALAEVTAEEARQLGTTLTPMGAERAGNKAGTIPEWTGGLCKAPAGYSPKLGPQAGGAPYVDPVAADKPLFRITRANLAQYADKIDDGTKELFRRYPTFAIDIYPTRRLACYADWVYENTAKRINMPKLVGNAPGITGAHAQVPFPIPKSGAEVMWNVILKFEPVRYRFKLDAGLMDTSGTFTRASFQVADTENLYWDNTVTSLLEDKPYRRQLASNLEPASQAGLASLRMAFLRQDLHDDMAWSYVPGQRRVRRAPEFKYDTVSTTSGGLLIFDEIGGFDGKLDKYNWKLLGKREMYVPANDYRFLAATTEETMKKDHANPDLFRWELRRVWVVEGSLKEGERHIQQKKVFLVDEDSWISPIYYSVDHSGKIHHLMHLPPIQEYDKPGTRTGAFVLYDMPRNLYGFQTKPQGRPDQYGYMKVSAYPSNFFSPDSLAGRGIR